MEILYSFDIFDTLIARRCGQPHNVFYYVEKIIQDNYDIGYFGEDIYSGFADIRITAEQMLTNRFDKENSIWNRYTLNDIYNQIEENHNVAEERIKELKQLELDAELELSLPVTDSINHIKRLINEGRRVVLISDMYLDSVQIRKLLVKCDDVFITIPIYVSCEYGLHKSSGLLYRIVYEAEQVDYSNWIHYGDNRISDVLIPKALGIEAHLVEANDKKSEIIIDRKSSVKKRELFINNHIEVESKAQKLGYQYGGLILMPYITWCLKVATQNSINDIYFIARDGYVLKKIADIIIDNKKLTITTHYLYGSREAWSVDESNIDEIRKYLLQEIDFSRQNLFVDLQGTGRSLCNALNTVKGKEYKRQLCTCFDKVSPVIRENCRIMSFSDKNDATYIELLGRAPHGVTYAYKVDTDGDNMVPVFAEFDSGYNEKIKQYVLGVEQFVRDNVNRITCNDTWKDLVDISRCALKELNRCDDEELMNYIYDMPFGDDRDENTIYAPKLNMDEIYKYINENIVDALQWYKGMNLNLSLNRCTQDEQNIIAQNRRIDYDKISCEGIKSDDIRIVLYGAGKRGKNILYYLMNNDNIRVVQCIDINADNLKSQGLPVDKVPDIRAGTYDYVLVSIVDEELHKGSRYILEENGVLSDRIINEQQLKEILTNR